MRIFFFNEAYPEELRALGALTLAWFVIWFVIFYFVDAGVLWPSLRDIWFPLVLVQITMIGVVIEWKRRIDRARPAK